MARKIKNVRQRYEWKSGKPGMKKQTTCPYFYVCKYLGKDIILFNYTILLRTPIFVM